MTLDRRMLDFVAGHRAGVLATLKRDGRPQLSNLFYAYDPRANLVRISVTADRAKTRNVQADPRVTLHVTSPDFWSWVAVDATVDELVAYYRATNGEHGNWDEYRAAMVADRRLVLRFTPEHTYGQLPG